jgi:non-heme chloroperoxidase
MAEIALDTGVTLAYDEAGSREDPPVILIHGISMGRRYFHKQIGALANRNRVIAVDLRGHGGSEKTPSGHTVPHYARDLDAFIRALDLQRPILLGWSMGAFVTFDYIRQFGTGAIRGLVIVDEAASDFKWDDFPHGFVDLPTLHELMTEVQEDRMGFLRHLVPEMFHNEQEQADLEWMVAECAQLPIGALSAILFDQSVQDYREDVRKIDVPTLICWGRHDALLPVSGAPYMFESIPNARLELFEDSGHCPFLEETQRFNEVLGAFLAEF